MPKPQSIPREKQPVPKSPVRDRSDEERSERPDSSQSSDSGIVSPEKDRLVEEHFREHPEGDPAVRRIHPGRDKLK
jgi:hypothetical protein